MSLKQKYLQSHDIEYNASVIAQNLLEKNNSIKPNPIQIELFSNFDKNSAMHPPKDAYTIIHDPITYEVHIKSHVSLKDYELITQPKEMRQLIKLAKSMKNKKMMFINATASGGGVAIMRAPLIHLLKLLNVDAHWYALMPDEPYKRFFDVTKQKFHNVLQGVANPDVRLNEEDKKIYNHVIKDNVRILKKPLSNANVIIIDDWQPSGIIPYLKGDESIVGNNKQPHVGLNPNAAILFRDHIHTEGKLMNTPGTPQFTTWKFIWDHNQVNKADVFITHPVDEFVPPDVPDAKVVFMPATADLLDDLNRPLMVQEQNEGVAFINDQLAINENQKPIDLNRPYIVLIARFDPSKGMALGMASYAKAIKKMQINGAEKKDIPQLVVLGNGSVDDPDGIPVLAEIMSRRSRNYTKIKDDIKVARVPHNDTAINALLKGARLALQPSTKEGFESRVSDAIFQNVPVIGSDRGGIPLQIVEGESGFIVDPYDTEKWADLICMLMSDTQKYNKLKQRTSELAITNNKTRFTTVSNAIRWLALSAELLNNPTFKGNRRWAEELIN